MQDVSVGKIKWLYIMTLIDGIFKTSRKKAVLNSSGAPGAGAFHKIIGSDN